MKVMQTLSHEIAEKAKELSEMDKLRLIDELLEQINKPDPEIDAVWAEEAQKRWCAYREGKIEAIPYVEVMRKYKKS